MFRKPYTYNGLHKTYTKLFSRARYTFKLRGLTVHQNFLWTALVTPFDAKAAVDFPSLERLLRKQESAGNGALVLGSTGESLALTDTEKRGLIEKVCALELKIPLMVGVSGTHLPSTLDWLRFCQQLPIDAYLLSVPHYVRPGCEGQERWFFQLLDAVDRPCMFYNHPGRAGSAFHIKAARAVSEHENAWAIKDASGDRETLLRFKEELPHIQLYSGNDDKLRAFCQAGGSGLVSVMANTWPRETRAYVQSCLGGLNEESDRLWLEAAQAVNVCNPVSVKQLLYQKEWIQTPYPRLPLHPDDGKSPSVLIRQNQLIKQWFSHSYQTQKTP